MVSARLQLVGEADLLKSTYTLFTLLPALCSLSFFHSARFRICPRCAVGNLGSTARPEQAWPRRRRASKEQMGDTLLPALACSCSVCLSVWCWVTGGCRWNGFAAFLPTTSTNRPEITLLSLNSDSLGAVNAAAARH